MTTLTCIIPTIGRRSLADTIASVAPQLGGADQIVVVADGTQGTAMEQYLARPAYDVPIDFLQLPERANDYGCTPCDAGIALAEGSFFWFLADDDLCAPRAVERIRAEVGIGPVMPHLFAMRHLGRTLSGSLERGKVSGQQIVVPNSDIGPKMVGAPSYDMAYSDWHYIQRVVAAWKGIIMHGDIICELKQMGEGRL